MVSWNVRLLCWLITDVARVRNSPHFHGMTRDISPDTSRVMCTLSERLLLHPFIQALHFADNDDNELSGISFRRFKDLFWQQR